MPPLDPDRFRSILGRFASGITIVTALDASGGDHGMTVSAFCSVSLTPPLVLVCVDHAASMHGLLMQTEAVAVNILAEGQEAISRRFADPDGDRFDGIGFRRGERGVAVLDEALAHLEGTIVARHEAGDHTILVIEAEQGSVHRERPLLYYRSGYAQLDR